MIIVGLCKRPQSTKLEEDEDARVHVTRLLDLREQLAFMGKNFDDDEFVSILSGSLPPSYEPTINVINAAADQMVVLVTLDRVIRLVTMSPTSTTAAGSRGARTAQTKQTLKRYAITATGSVSIATN